MNHNKCTAFEWSVINYWGLKSLLRAHKTDGNGLEKMFLFPTLKHIAFGLCVRASVRLCLRPFVQAIVLKVNVWNSHDKINDPFFRTLSSCGIMRQ